MIDQKLIQKFYNGECSEQEVHEILNLFENQKEAENEIANLWKEHKGASASSPDSELLLLEIHKQLGLNRRKKVSLSILHSQWFKVAAIVVFSFLLPLLLLKENNSLYELTEVKQHINKINPAGKRSVIHLPDGSVVHLNAASSITYVKGFEDSLRKIELTGEAYFEVATNPEKPFVVRSSEIETRALGTAFNVKAYTGEEVEVVLAEGKVSVVKVNTTTHNNVILEPGTLARLNSDESKVLKEEADLYTALAWKNDMIVFRQSSAEEVFTTLERWYGVSISYPQEFVENEWNFTGEFEKESLENVLLSISYVKSFNYKLDDKIITITP